MCKHAWMHVRKLCSSFDRFLEDCDRHQMFSCIPTALLFCASLLSKLTSLSPVSSRQIEFLFFLSFLILPLHLFQLCQYEVAPAYCPCCQGGPLRLSCWGLESARSYQASAQFPHLAMLSVYSVRSDGTQERAYAHIKLPIVCCMWPHGIS